MTPPSPSRERPDAPPGGRADGRPGPFLVVAGPTAVGKTALALELAEKIGAEILSADSRQVYRGLDVGTAKPPPEERARAPHHFIDEKTLDEPWSAGRFADEANARIAGILARGRVPLVVGGSTLYLEALVHGLSDVPAAPPEVRAALMREAATPDGRLRLYHELRAADPATADTLDPTKSQRLVRALEPLRTTGRTRSDYLAHAPRPPFRYRVVVLERPRDSLYRRINDRVDAMLAAGLLDENKKLLAAGHPADANPLRTIGYQEPLAHLRGEIAYDEMVRLLKLHSRRYAKRQLTWFRRRPAYLRLDLATDPHPPTTLLGLS